MVAPITGERWLVDMADSLIEQPIVNALFIDGADLVSVLADESLPTIPSVGLYFDAKLSAAITDRGLGDAKLAGDISKRASCFVESGQLSASRERGMDAFAASIPDLWFGNAVLSEPVRDCCVIHAEVRCHFVIGQMFDMDHSVEFVGCGLGDTSIGETATSSACRDAIVDQPTPDFSLRHTLQSADLPGGQSLDFVEVPNLGFSRSHDAFPLPIYSLN